MPLPHIWIAIQVLHILFHRIHKPSSAQGHLDHCTKSLGYSFLNLPLYEFKTVLENLHDTVERSNKDPSRTDFTNDIDYIERLLHRMDHLGASNNATKVAKDALNYLSDRNEFWSQHHV